MPVLVRPETPADIEAIHRINALAFGQPQEADLVDALRKAGALVISFVAVRDDAIVGHIAFSPVTIEPETGPVNALGLAPMAVLPEFQKQGIGSQLVNAGLDACRMQGTELVVVLGHPEYYPRFGFIPASKLGLQCEYPVPDEAFMAQIGDGSLKQLSGLVKYHPVFQTVAD